MTDSPSTLQKSYQYGASMFSSPTDKKKDYQIYLFGYPIAHSLAPKLHNTLFATATLPWTYTLHESLDTPGFLPLLQSASTLGSAVTMPHKVSFVSQVDELTEEARMIGAINTVFKRKDSQGKTKLIGTNTDTIGIREAFLRNHPGIVSRSKGKPALVIGGGGACRSALYALWKWMGVSKIYMVNRLDAETQAIKDAFDSAAGFDGELIMVMSVAQAEELDSPVLIVGTVPDAEPKEPGEILARQITMCFLGKKEKGVVLEMCYHPKPKTAFYRLATQHGWDVILGPEPMVHQGIAQQILWREEAISEASVQEAEGLIRAALENH